MMRAGTMSTDEGKPMPDGTLPPTTPDEDVRPLRVIVDEEKCDRASIEAALACAASRNPNTVGQSAMSGVTIIEMTWRRLDSPKQAATFRISCMNSEIVGHLNKDQLRAVAEQVLRAALVDDTTEEILREIQRDLEEASSYAAWRFMDGHETPAGVRMCYSSAGTPWTRAVGNLAVEADAGWKNPQVAMLDADGLAALLPDMPDVVLMREADFAKTGHARIVVGPMHGEGADIAGDPLETMRLSSRFALGS
jgi:hypothetical protein